MRSEGNERTRSDELSHHDKVDHDHPTTHAEASRRQSAYKKRTSGGSSYGLQAWEKTIEYNKASSPLQHEQVVGCKRGADGGDHRRTKTGGIRGNNDYAHAQNACTGLGMAVTAADVRKV